MNCNKLHVNLEKSCYYMYFNNTRKTENTERLNISNTSFPQIENINKRKVSIKEKFIFTSQSNYILYMIYTKLVMNSKSVYKFT